MTIIPGNYQALQLVTGYKPFLSVAPVSSTEPCASPTLAFSVPASIRLPLMSTGYDLSSLIAFGGAFPHDLIAMLTTMWLHRPGGIRSSVPDLRFLLSEVSQTIQQRMNEQIAYDDYTSPGASTRCNDHSCYIRFESG
jgi:hypothetical protein